MHPDLLAILVCPEDHGSLTDVDGEFLYNPRLRRAYPIRD
ncbi:MAG: Trm112 family protein, partial [Actinomycetia bacterium]|nr:Trm112 family protein [Actinomycetes bacterium]